MEKSARERERRRKKEGKEVVTKGDFDFQCLVINGTPGKRVPGQFV